MRVRKIVSALAFLLCISLSLGAFAENTVIPLTSQKQFDEKLNELMYDGDVQIKKDVTDASLITMSQLGKIYSAGSGTQQERDDARNGDLSSVYDKKTDTFIMSLTSNATEYAVSVPSDTTDFCVLFGADANHVKYEEIHFVYTDNTSECVLYCGENFKGSFVHIDVKNTADASKILKQIKVVKPNVKNYKNENGETLSVTDAVRFYVKEIVVLTDYTEPYEDEYPDEKDVIKFFEDYENENSDKADISMYARAYTANYTAKNYGGLKLADKLTLENGKNALDGDFDTYFAHKNENGFVYSYVFDSPVMLSNGFLVFDIFSDKENNDVYRFFSVSLEYADGETEKVYDASYYLPPQIMEISPQKDKAVSKITVTKPSAEEISGLDCPKGASYPSGAVDFKLSEAKFYSDDAPKVNVALGKRAKLDTNGGKVSYICGNEKRLTDGYKFNDLGDTELLAATYDTASPKSFSMTLDLGSVYNISSVELYGIDKNMTASKDNLAWTKYDISDISVVGSLDGKVYNIPVGTSKNYADIDEAAGTDKSYSRIDLSSPEGVRYLKFARSGISGYTRISEIRVLTDDKTVNTENFDFDENSASAEVKNYSDEQKEVTLLYAKHGENGDMLGLSGDYNVLEKGKSANLSAQYSDEEQFASYTACIIDSFKNLAVYTADEYSVSGENSTDTAESNGTDTVLLNANLPSGIVFSNAVITVLKPGFDFENLDDGILTAPENYVYDFKLADILGSVKYTLPKNAPNGKYQVIYSVSDTAQNTYKAYGYCLKSDDTAKAQCVEDFKSATEENITSVIENYTNITPVLSFDGVYGWNDIKDKIGKMFIAVRNSFIKGEMTGKAEEFADLGDIEKCMKGAYVLYYADQNDKTAFDAVFDINGLEYLFDKSIKSEKYLSMYAETKGENPVKSARLCTALCKIENGTYEDIENALTLYADILGIDLNYADEKGVTVAEAAKYIDNQNVAKYKNGMKTYFETACSKASEKSGGNGGGSSSSSSKGGSKGSFPSISPSIPENPEKEELFSDLHGFDWAKEAVENMAEKGILSGVGNKKFEPSRNVTRAEFVKILCKAFDISAPSAKTMNFSDVNSSDWYEPYVFKFYSAGYINGINEEYFGANDTLTRQDACVICARVLGISTEFKYELDKKKPVDLDIADTYAKGSIYNMYNKSLINGNENGEFMPYKALSRAEAAVLVSNILNLR